MSSFGYVNSGLSALANATQTGAYQILNNAYLNQFTTVTAGALNSCLLPLNPVNGEICKIRNDSATGVNLNVYPQVGGQINALGNNVAYVLQSGAIAEFISTGSLTWLVSNVANCQLIEQNAVTAIAATAAITPQECGIINVTSAAANIALTLPGLIAGLRYHICILATAGTNTVTVTATGAFIKSIICGAATLVTNAACTNIIYGTTAIAGDYLDLYCDGNFWHGIAVSNVAGAITRS